jgi:hypothetical protein
MQIKTECREDMNFLSRMFNFEHAILLNDASNHEFQDTSKSSRH